MPVADSFNSQTGGFQYVRIDANPLSESILRLVHSFLLVVAVVPDLFQP